MGDRPFGEIIYTSEEDGMAQLNALGFSDHVAAARSLYPEAPVSDALYGDLAVIETPDGPALGGVGGSYVLAPAMPRGLSPIPLVAADRGGRVISILALR